MTTLAVHLDLTHSGWTLRFPHDRSAPAVVSGYLDTWTDHIGQMAPHIIGTDTTMLAEEDATTLRICGPMCLPDLPAGTVRPIDASLRPWIDRPSTAGDPRLGNARGLDYVALDVYLEITERFGGVVFDPRTRLTDATA